MSVIRIQRRIEVKDNSGLLQSVNIFDEEGFLIQTEEYDSGVINEIIFYNKYGNRTKIQKYDNGILNYVAEYSYTEDRYYEKDKTNPDYDEYYDNEGVLVYKNIYTDGNYIRYDKNGLILGRGEIDFEGMVSYYEYEYGADGRIASEKQYYQDEYLGTIEYYDNGNIKNRMYYDIDNMLIESKDNEEITGLLLLNRFYENESLLREDKYEIVDEEQVLIYSKIIGDYYVYDNNMNEIIDDDFYVYNYFSEIQTEMDRTIGNSDNEDNVFATKVYNIKDNSLDHSIIYNRVDDDVKKYNLMTKTRIDTEENIIDYESYFYNNGYREESVLFINDQITRRIKYKSQSVEIDRILEYKYVE